MRILILFFFIANIACAQQKSDVEYDSLLAQKVGADQYGMKTYALVYLKNGPNRNQDSATIAKIQRGHMDHIQKMSNDGKLILAGPFMDNGDVRGIFIFNTSLEEAKQLTEKDPAVISGRLIMELHSWYGSAALMTIPETHQKVQKTKI
jgi:uncharacterized protein YciI